MTNRIILNNTTDVAVHLILYEMCGTTVAAQVVFNESFKIGHPGNQTAGKAGSITAVADGIILLNTARSNDSLNGFRSECILRLQSYLL